MHKKCSINITLITLIGLLGLASIPYLIEVSHPKYAYIGDEWDFFNLGYSLVTRYFLVNPFSGGVFTNNAIFPLMMQAWPMAIVGQTIAAWKFANLFSIFIGGILTFLWVRIWFGQSVAFLSAAVFGCSSYLWSFSLVGYTHQFGVIHLLLLYFLVSHIVKIDSKLSTLLIVGVGVVAGLSFYEFGGLVFPIILSPYLVFLLNTKLRPELLRRFSIITLVGFAIAVPGLLNQEYRESVFSLAAFPQHVLSLWDRLRHGLEYLSAFAYMTKDSHYAYGPYIDAISRIGVVVGLLAVLRTLLRFNVMRFTDFGRGSFIILSCTILTAFSYGMTSPYPEPPRTRGIFLVPHFAVLAGIGFNYIVNYFPKNYRTALVAVIVAACFFLNLVRRNQFFTQVGVTADSCILWKIADQNFAIDTPITVYLRAASPDTYPLGESDMLTKVNGTKVLLTNFGVTNVETAPLTYNAPVPKGASLVIDLEREIYQTGCRDLASLETSWYASKMSVSARWW